LKPKGGKLIAYTDENNRLILDHKDRSSKTRQGAT
jgi:hypothetical protein